MGYLLTLEILAPELGDKIIYKKTVFQSAKCTTNILSGETLQLKEDQNFFFLIEDTMNDSLLDENVFHLFYEWRNGIKPFDKNILDINKIQYIEFEYESSPFYVCLCQGTSESYCFLKLFPESQFNYIVEKKYLSMNSYYELDMRLWIEQKEEAKNNKF